MLGMPERLDPEWVKLGMSEHWKHSADYRAAQRNRLELHLAALLDQGIGELSLDERLVRDVRSRLKPSRLSDLIYGRLKRSAREVLVMRYIQQQSYDDIARQMGKTSHQVRAMCSRSIGRLRDMLGSNHSQSVSKEIKNVQNR